MAERCTICLDALDAGTRNGAHASCARALFGVPRVPPIDVDPRDLHLFGAQMAGHATLAGVLSKLSLGWSQKSLRVEAENQQFLLKPQSSTYPELPENEHVSTLLARLVGLETARVGLVELGDGKRALVVRRFDRTNEGTRLPMEDFCQLAGLLPKEKYSGSAELCARTIRQFSSAPGLDLLTLFRTFVAAWWIGNGDLHSKNLALLCPTRDERRLSPAYDVVSTRLVLANDDLALTICGRRSKLRRREWSELGAYCGLPPRVVERELARPAAVLDDARALVARSFLSAERRARYAELLAERAEAFA